LPDEGGLNASAGFHRTQTQEVVITMKQPQEISESTRGEYYGFFFKIGRAFGRERRELRDESPV
jgi:hypothetical protein